MLYRDEEIDFLISDPITTSLFAADGHKMPNNTRKSVNDKSQLTKHKELVAAFKLKQDNFDKLQAKKSETSLK